MFVLRAPQCVNRTVISIVLSNLLVIILLGRPPLTYAQMPDDVFRIMQKASRGEELTPAEEKRQNEWLATQSTKKAKGPDTYKDAHGRFWRIEAAGHLGLKCTDRTSSSVSETSHDFNLSFNTYQNGIDPASFHSQREMLRIEPAPLAYFGFYTEGDARLVETNQSSTQSSRRECQASIDDSHINIFLEKNSLPEPVPLIEPEPPPVPLIDPMPLPAPLGKRASRKPPQHKMPIVSPTWKLNGHGLLLLPLEYKCTVVTTDNGPPPKTSRGPDGFSDTVEIPIELHVNGNDLTANLVRCDDSEEMETELQSESPAAARLGIGGTCRLFPGDKNIPCVITGTLKGKLTQIEGKR